MSVHKYTPAQLPAIRRTATPFHTIEWSHAWSRVSTEQVTGYQVKRWPHEGHDAAHMPFYRVQTSPLWTAMEGDADLEEPVWRGPVTYARSLYAEYGGIPHADDTMIKDAVDSGRDLAHRWRTQALVVSNLTSAEVERWSALRRPDATVGLYWAHRVDLNSNIGEFVAADQHAKKSRRELRRQWRRGAESGLHAKFLHGTQMLSVLPKIVELARATSERHGPALYGLDMLALLCEVPGAFAVIADHAEGLAGAFICFYTGDTVYLWAAGIDQARRRTLNTYAWLMYTSLAYACELGAQALDAGRGNYQYKAQMGLHAEPLSCLVYLTRPDPDLVERLETMHRGLYSHVQQAWAGRRRSI